MNLEQLVTDTLEERADSAAYPTTRYWDVVDRAAGLRNRRRHRVLAVAASVAVVVPLAIAGVSIQRASEGSPANPHPTQPTPTKHHRSHHPERIPSFAEVRRGPAPKVAYLAGNTVVEPEGTRHALPKGAAHGTDWAVPLGDGYLLHSNDEIGTGNVDSVASILRRVEGDTVTELGCGSNYLGTEAGGGRVAYWVAASCGAYRSKGVLYVADVATGQATPYLATTKRLGSLDPVGIVGDRVIAESDTKSSSSVVSIGPDGSVRRVRGLKYAFSFDRVHGLVAGETPSGRHVMLDPLTGNVKWSTPWNDWTLNSVSPDGRVVLGISQDSVAQKFALLDASDGHVLGIIHPVGPPDFSTVAADERGWVWDHDALLSNVDVGGSQDALLRSTASGTTLATKPAPYRPPRNGAIVPTFYGLMAP